MQLRSTAKKRITMSAFTASGSRQAYFDTTYKEQHQDHQWSLYSNDLPDSNHDTFDLASIHPSHGLSPISGAFMTDGSAGEGQSEAQKIMAAMLACGSEHESNNYVRQNSSNGTFDEPQDWTSDSSFGTSLPDEASQLGYNDSATSSFHFGSSLSSSTASMSLERVSSCYFDPPSVEQHTRESLVPLDGALHRRLSTSTTPSIPTAASSQGHMLSSAALSFSLAPTQSTSSFMMRSYSAPAQTQAQFNVLKQKWNIEALAAAELTEAGPSSQGQTSPRPKITRRNTSASIPSLRRQRDSCDEDASYSYGSQVHDTFTSRAHLLSPAHKHNPFKRSRLSFTAIREADDTFPEEAGSPQSSTTERRAPSPPKSPVRPSLNRFFTSPEFYLGDSRDIAGDDDDEDFDASIA
jgi:hypothetical protein